MKKEVKNKKKNNKFLKVINKVKDFFIKYRREILLILPFILMDLFTRILGYKIHFYSIFSIVPNLFTIIWVTLIVGIILSFKKNIGKIIYVIFFIISFALFTVNNVYYSMTSSFFDFSLVLLAGEGSGYFMDAIVNCNKVVYLLMIVILCLFSLV